MNSSGLFNIEGNGLRRPGRARPFPADEALPQGFDHCLRQSAKSRKPTSSSLEGGFSLLFSAARTQLETLYLRGESNPHSVARTGF